MPQEFWKRTELFASLSNESKEAWESIIRVRDIRKNDYFLNEGDTPKTVAFVSSGLFAQYFAGKEGELIIKNFFREGNFMASLSALLIRSPSLFTIKALESSSILEFNFYRFKDLLLEHGDLMRMYIVYLERNWVLEKEPLEVSFRKDTATTRYLNFSKEYPGLEPRLKQHEVASYLGITPTQLSRIRSECSH